MKRTRKGIPGFGKERFSEWDGEEEKHYFKVQAMWFLPDPRWLPAKTTSTLFSCSGFRVKEWRSPQRRRANSTHSDIFLRIYEPLKTKDINTSDHLCSESCIAATPTLRRSAHGQTFRSRSDVPQCRHSRESLRESHVVSKPNFGSQLWRRNGYICVYFYWPPGPNPVVTISTRVGPGSRLTSHDSDMTT